MAVRWQIPFKSLRTGTLYTVNIYDATYNGLPVVLKGAAQPFTTQEDSGEDMFMPIRTQSGYLRIFDNDKDFNGNALTADWWKLLVPAKDSDRPVTLTANNTVVWQGFMQAQSFSGTLYGNPQEREFPVTCALSVLAGEDIDFNQGLKNFAFLLKNVCDTIDTYSNSSIHISTIMVQGGADARKWLQTKIDWQNFATEDSDGTQRAKYSLFSVLEDMCRFWGWTARTCGTTLYLTCADDAGEQNFLSLTRNELTTLTAATSDTWTGSIVAPPTVTLADTAAAPIFASTDNEDYKIQGPHRAVVKADCNEHDTIVKFAPKDVEDWIEQGASPAGTYEWVQGDGDLVGYFTCPNGVYKETGRQGTNIGTKTLKVSTSAYGGVSRRQIYQSAESESPVVCDMLMSLANRPNYNESIIQLQTLRPMSFGGGSISLGGTLWRGAEPLQHSGNKYTIRAKLGIGMRRASAKWWYMNDSAGQQTIDCGWETGVEHIFNIPLSGNNLKSTGFRLWVGGIAGDMYIYPSIPVNPNTYGYIFIDIMYGFDYTNESGENQGKFDDFQIADFSIEYSRDSYNIPSSVSEVRPRELKTERITSKEYAAVNTNDSKEEWNANCIFASDNNMEYGYGLLIDGNGNIIDTVYYGSNPEHPEQHLADRVARYWATAKRKIDADLKTNVAQSITPSGTISIGDITPLHKVSANGSTFVPVGISRTWRDDIVKLSLMQL